MMHSVPYQGVCSEMSYGITDLIFTKFASTRQRSVHLLTLRRILSESDNKCGECGLKFLEPLRNVGFTPLFTTVAATSYTSYMSVVRKVLQIAVNTYTLQEKFRFSLNFHLLAGIVWILYRILFESDEKCRNR